MFDHALRHKTQHNITEITQTVFPFTFCTTLLTQQITICHNSIYLYFLITKKRVFYYFNKL